MMYDFPKIPMPGVKPVDPFTSFKDDNVDFGLDITEYVKDVRHFINQVDEAVILQHLMDKGYVITHEHPEYMEHIMSKIKPKEE